MYHRLHTSHESKCCSLTLPTDCYLDHDQDPSYCTTIFDHDQGRVERTTIDLKTFVLKIISEGRGLYSICWHSWQNCSTKLIWNLSANWNCVHIYTVLTTDILWWDYIEFAQKKFCPQYRFIWDLDNFLLENQYEKTVQWILFEKLKVKNARNRSIFRKTFF